MVVSYIFLTLQQNRNFKFTDINLAREAKNRLIHDYIDQPKYSKACASLDDGFEDAFQYTVQGNSHNRLKSTNLIERLNQEVRRRERLFASSQSNISQSLNWSRSYGPT